MTQETEQALKAAQTKLAAAREAAEAAKQDCLNDMASRVPAAVEAAARSLGDDQPDVMRALGREGVAALRQDLAAAAALLAHSIRGGMEGVDWPTTRGGYYDASPRGLKAALRDFIEEVRHESPTYQARRGIANLLTARGFSMGSLGQKGLPKIDDLYDSEILSRTAEALDRVIDAESDYKAAKKADDQAAVDDLWQ